MSTDTEDPETEDSTDGDDHARSEIRIPGVEVTDEGRVTIPSRIRDRHDIVEEDVVDAFLEREDAEDVTALDLIVDSSGRVRIPSRKRDIYDIEADEVIDVTIRTTGISAE